MTCGEELENLWNYPFSHAVNLILIKNRHFYKIIICYDCLGTCIEIRKKLSVGYYCNITWLLK